MNFTWIDVFPSEQSGIVKRENQVIDDNTYSKRFLAVSFFHILLGLQLAVSVVCQATEKDRQWIVYLAQPLAQVSC